MKGILLQTEHGDSRDYNSLGCSPQTLNSFISWLSTHKNEIKELSLALYLFNNEHLFDALLSLTDAGIKVTVYSIPLEGYDDRYPMAIADSATGKPKGLYSKYDLAKVVYHRAETAQSMNFQLRIVPHMYLRSKRVHPFSRGSMPYSLHIKTFSALMKTGEMYAGLTSSNLAVRDAQKNEISVLCQLGKAEMEATKDFYQGLYENSIPIADFDNAADYSHYQITMRPTPPKSRTMYIAPFYYDSASLFEEHISSIVTKASRRILICAQHISAYNYSYEDRTKTPIQVQKPGFLNAVLDQVKVGVNTQFLSQTYVDNTGLNNCRAPENKGAFIGFVEAARKAHCSYYVNADTHGKFIVADDHVLLTTCNFTPTQFIYIPSVEIPEFDRMPGLSYSGIHCEIGAYFVISSTTFSEQVNKEFSDMVRLPRTQKMF